MCIISQPGTLIPILGWISKSLWIEMMSRERTPKLHVIGNREFCKKRRNPFYWLYGIQMHSGDIIYRLVHYWSWVLVWLLNCRLFRPLFEYWTRLNSLHGFYLGNTKGWTLISRWRLRPLSTFLTENRIRCAKIYLCFDKKDKKSILSDWKRLAELVTGCLRMMKSCYICIKWLKSILS